MQVNRIDIQPPPYLKPFLVEPGSLTQKLFHMTGDARVSVVSGNFKPLDWWAKYHLLLSGERLFQREILMYSGQHVCWYARTLIPALTWYTHTRFFHQLNHKNLSNLLFDDPDVEKISQEYRPVYRDDLLFYWLPPGTCQNKDVLWVKCSRFAIQKQADFYLTEIFLPELEPCLLNLDLPIGV